MTNFDDQLWSYLVIEHGADRVSAAPPTAARRRQRPLLASAGAAGLAAIAAGIVIALTATSATPPAFAVTNNHDGTATVTLRQISAIGALNARLAALGIRAKAVPVRADCRAKDQVLLGYSHWKTSLGYKVTVGNRWLDPGYTAIMAVKQTPSGVEATFAAVPTRLAPNCVPDKVLPPPRPGS